MRLTVAFTFSLFGLVLFIPSSSGKPLQTGSPGPMYTLPGKDAILPCSAAISVDASRVTVTEWLRVDTSPPMTVHAVRQGKDLKWEEPQYSGRTEVMQNSSLKLLGVRQGDSGTYSCVLRGESSVVGEAFVSLIFAQVSEVNMSVRRTAANELFVHCESSGWRPEPLVSLLDSRRNNIPAARMESPIQLNGFYSVMALVNVAAAEAAPTGNGTLICRVEIPGMDLANENKIFITDEFVPLQTELGYSHWMVNVIVTAYHVVIVAAVAAVLFFVPVEKIQNLRSSLKGWLNVFAAAQTPTDSDCLTTAAGGEYGDVRKLETSGASEATAKANQLCTRGIEASYELAKTDLKEMSKYKDIIVSVGQRLGIQPALIAAIISRQSQAGTKLRKDGYGQFDSNCFGLMQINKNYHAVKGNPFSWDHVDEGITFFIQLIKTMQRENPQWNKEQQLKGALACYVAGPEKVIGLTYENVDSETPRGDFANDVVARAQYFADQGY